MLTLLGSSHICEQNVAQIKYWQNYNYHASYSIDAHLNDQLRISTSKLYTYDQ